MFEGCFEDVEQEDLKFLFGEAVYFCENGRSVSLMEIWKRKTEKTNSDMFVREYLMSKSLMSDFTLGTLLGLKSNHVVFLDYIRGRISGDLTGLDNTSKFLIMNINLIQCFEHHPELTTDIFDILLDNEESADWRMFNNMYRKASKEFMVARISEEKPSGSTVSVCNQRIPNLFHGYKQVKKRASVERTCDNAASISSSLFMVLEYINWYGHYSGVTDSVLEKLSELRRKNKWTRVHPEFVDTFQCMSDGDMNKIKNSADITSSTVCDKVTTMWDFVTKSATYSFNMGLPGQLACDNDHECGFLIEVTGVSRENPELDVQLVGDTNRHPTDMQLADYSDKLQVDNKWDNYNISWEGRPLYLDYGSVMWGSTGDSGAQDPVRLVV